ncbi:MAG: hypothetical protein R6U26_03345 [Candidatus Undinarchaeales archaeon]
MNIKKLKRLDVKKLADELDDSSSELMLRILKHMDSENVYYTSLLAKKLRYTWANTSAALKKLGELGLIKTCEYVEKYNKKYGNITGLALTKKGNFVRRKILKPKK